jgi:hypothetical protein
MKVKKSSRLKMPWKKGFRKIPPRIDARLKQLKGKDLRVEAVIRVSWENLKKGLYAHLGVRLIGGKLSSPEKILPDRAAGPASKYNVEAKEIIHRDRPKVPITYSAEVPNYGDWYRGSHSITFEREAYPRTRIRPKLIEIGIERLDETDKEVVLKFSLDHVLDRSQAGFRKELLSDLNLLQENVGTSGIFPSDVPRSEYLKTITVDWEILPPGNRADVLSKIKQKLRLNKTQQKILSERFDLLESLKPLRWVAGTSGLQRYFGAQFGNDFVVFENLEYGNAIYVLFQDWQELSKLSRIDLLHKHPKKILRIVHTSGWIDRLRKSVRAYLKHKK